ncbi:TPA: hypothetical protein N0F65_007858 [Lagenidium giganteum]|uniref:Gag-pol polyprotein n=1 Tax=Lagenidium giganteum TaxID=4803 RepID=A0AAV2YHL1_9STRA|nr:TPA: hypothetical protein N0F65_007858 [Lagenidium giganteum]
MGLHEGDLAPRGQRSSSEGGSDLLVVAAKVAGFGRPLRVLVDSGALKNYARRQTMAENARLLAQACARDRGLISMRLATGVVATVKKVELDLRVAFVDFDSVERFTVLDMDERFELILGMPWLARHEPWIDWKTKSIHQSVKILGVINPPSRRAREHSPPLEVGMARAISRKYTRSEQDARVGTTLKDWNLVSALRPRPKSGRCVGAGAHGCAGAVARTEAKCAGAVARTSECAGAFARTEGGVGAVARACA